MLIIAAVIIIGAFAIKSVVTPKKSADEPEKPEVNEIMTRKITPRDFNPDYAKIFLDFTSNASDKVKKINFLVQSKVSAGEIPYIIEDPDGEKVSEGTLTAGENEKELTFEYKKGTWNFIADSSEDDEANIRIVFAQKIQAEDRIWTVEDKSGYIIDSNK